MTTAQQVLQILNNGGAHLPTVSEFEQIATVINNPERKKDVINRWIVKLHQRFEELTRGKWVTKTLYPELDKDDCDNSVWNEFQPALLTKDRFVPIETACVVCDGRGKGNFDGDSNVICCDSCEGEGKVKSLSKVWFAGKFEINEGVRTEIYIKDVGLFVIGENTIFDIFCKIELNRTASQKIALEFTENFVNELIK